MNQIQVSTSPEFLGNAFAAAAAELSVQLLESTRRTDPEAYEAIHAGFQRGLQLVASVVVSKADPQILLEMVDEFGSRHTLASISGQATINA